MSFIYQMLDTWNNAGTTFNSIYMNTSNGAGGPAVGAAASRLLRLDNNSTFVFDIDIEGKVRLAGQDSNTFFPGSICYTTLATGKYITTEPEANVDFMEGITNYVQIDATAPFTKAIQIYALDSEAIIGASNTTTIDVLDGMTLLAGNNGVCNVNSIRGFDAYVYNYGPAGGVTNEIMGSHSFVQLGADGTTNFAYGNQLLIDVTDTHTLTSAYSLLVLGLSKGVGASVTNNYGIYINDQSGIATTLNYNIYSAGAGVNAFIGLTGVGNVFNQTNLIFAPGDPVNASNGPYATYPVTFAVNKYESGDLSAFTGFGDIVAYSGYKHTGVSSTSITANDFEPIINSDSTGPFDNFIGLFSAPINYGSGNITVMAGYQMYSTHSGSGTITNAYGLFAGNQIDGGGAFTNNYGFYLRALVSAGGSVTTNNYGLYIEDNSGIATTLNYNIWSDGDGINYFGGMIRNNTRVVAGTHCTDTEYSFAPGDPTQETTIFYSATHPTFVASDFISGDLSLFNFSGLSFYNGHRHTGASSAGIIAVNAQPTINSNSTGPWSNAYGVYGSVINYGVGAIGDFIGVYGSPYSAGGAAITNNVGVYAWPYQDDTVGAGSTTNMYGVYVHAGSNVGAGTVTNNYGLYIEDQSGIATTLNYNIYSAGTSLNSLNFFGGTIISDSIDGSGGIRFIDSNPAISYLPSPSGGVEAYWRMAAVKANFSSVTDYTIGLAFNVDPTSPGSRIDTNQPSFRVNWEPYFKSGAGGQGLQEHNWSYGSIDGTVDYRPFQYNVNLTTHLATFGFTGNIYVIHRLNSDYAMTVTPNSSGAGGITIINGQLQINSSGQSTGGICPFIVSGDTTSGADLAEFAPSVLYDLQNILAVNLPTTTLTNGVRGVVVQGSISSRIENIYRNNSANGDVRETFWANAGDAASRYLTTAGDWTLGTDNSDSGRFKISRGDTLGTNDALSFDSSNNVRFFGSGFRLDQAPTANTSAGPTTITNGADGATNIGHRIKFNFNGTDYWIPCSSVAF